MPVRTDRGRAAVYRRLWGWPLRSPRHLALTALIAVIMGVGIALLTSLGAPDNPERAARATAASTRHRIPTSDRPATTPGQQPVTTSPRSAAASTPTTSVTPAPARSAAAPQDAVVTAREFAARWVIHPPGMTGQQWGAQLAPLVVPEYLSVLAAVDPSAIPATAVTGDPVVTSTSPAVTEVTVPTNAGGLHLVLLAQPDRTWRVRSYDPAAS